MRLAQVAVVFALCLLLAAWGAPRCLRAAPAEPLRRGITVKISKDEPLDALARRYYGAEPAVQALLIANGLPAWEQRLPRLKSGQSLYLPSAWSYRVRPGDTWAVIAEDYLGDGTKGPFLARLNGKSVTDAAPAGHVVIVPVILLVTMPRGVSLGRLSALLLELPERAPQAGELVGWIREYNGLKGDRLPRGQVIHVPLPTLRLLGYHMPTALPSGDPGVERRATAVLLNSREDLRRGRYLEALEALGALVGLAGLGEELLAEIHLWRCTALVALDHPRIALAAARAALAARPGLQLDPVQISPTVRAVFRRAARMPRSP